MNDASAARARFTSMDASTTEDWAVIGSTSPPSRRACPTGSSRTSGSSTATTRASPSTG